MKLPQVVLISFFLFCSGDLQAKQGCCSHHGGVCGDQCCDGTPLSPKCRDGENEDTTIVDSIPKEEDTTSTKGDESSYLERKPSVWLSIAIVSLSFISTLLIVSYLLDP